MCQNRQRRRMECLEDPFLSREGNCVKTDVSRQGLKNLHDDIFLCDIRSQVFFWGRGRELAGNPRVQEHPGL